MCTDPNPTFAKALAILKASAVLKTRLAVYVFTRMGRNYAVWRHCRLVRVPSRRMLRTSIAESVFFGARYRASLRTAGRLQQNGLCRNPACQMKMP